jgi:toxin CcdB
MAQYDVYVNPNGASRDTVPYLVDVQSRFLDHFSTRLMMPLLRFEAAEAGVPRNLMPRVRVRDESLVLYAHQAAAVQSRLLKKPVANLAPHASEILGALDAVVSGI